MKNTFNKLVSLAVATAMTLVLLPGSIVFAAGISDASDNMTRQKVSEDSDHVITFTPTTTDAGDIVVTFPVGFDLSTAASAGNTVNAGARTVTVTGGVTAATPETITVTGVGNPGTAANYVIAIATGADTGEITVPIITDDQIHITAKVDQTLTFDVRDATDGVGGLGTDNTVHFGTLTSGAARYATDLVGGGTSEAASSEIEAGTNASNGYIIDIAGETLTATNGSGNDIDGMFTPGTSTTGTEQFGINVVQTQASTDTVLGSSNGTVTGSYTGTNYHLPDSATTETLVTNAGPAANEIYDVTYLANISSLTPAGDYATDITYTMTAQF